MFRRYRRVGQVVGPAIATLLMVLCLGCQLQFPPTCQNCNAAVSAPGQQATETRFNFFESSSPDGVGPGTYLTPTIPRMGHNIVIEAFPIGAPGVATATVLDAPMGGSPTQATDSAAPGPPLSAYTKWMVRGVLQNVALKVVVTSGIWGFFGTFTDEASTVARAASYDRNQTAVTSQLAAARASVSGEGFVTLGGIYTVPTNRKAILMAYIFQIERTAAATTPGPVKLILDYKPVGGLDFNADVCILGRSTANNVVGALATSIVAPQMPMGAGDKVSMLGSNLDTGPAGSCNYSASCYIAEFDA